MEHRQYVLHLDVYSHGFRVSAFNDAIRRLLVEFCHRFIQWETKPNGHGRFIKEPSRVFATATALRNQYFFHRNVLDEFLAFMTFHGHRPESMSRYDRPMYKAAYTPLKWIDKTFVPYDYQVDIKDFLLKIEPPAKLVTLQAGGGKTKSVMFYQKEAQRRMVLIMKPMYMEQWKKVILSCFQIKKGDLLIVQGSKALQDLMKLALHDESFNPAIIMIANATYRNYLRSYLDHSAEDMGYPIKPWEFFERMQAACLTIDEVHQDFHLNFLIDCMSHVAKTVSMSATMVSDDPTMNKYYRIKFPPESYAPRPALKRYIEVHSINYRFDRPEKIRFIVRGKYHQATFEKSILRQPRVLNNYTTMITEIAKLNYLKHANYRPGMKLAIYCGTQEMCDAVLAKVKAAFPDHDCRRKIDVDPEINLIDGDIIVTTLQSAGTARDIPDLAVCIATIGLSARQASEQLIHRLRELKRWPDISPRFYFLWDRMSDKHRKYEEERKTKLDAVVKSFHASASSYII